MDPEMFDGINGCFLAGFGNFGDLEIVAVKIPRELVGLVKFKFPGSVCPPVAPAEAGVEVLLWQLLLPGSPSIPCPRGRGKWDPEKGGGGGRKCGGFVLMGEAAPVVIHVPPLPAL